jgi:hypothetical protein
MQIVGEIEMGEWVTVLGADGGRHQVEIRSTLMPWHRRPLDGEASDFAAMFAMLESTNHVLDQEPTGDDHAH